MNKKHDYDQLDRIIGKKKGKYSGPTIIAIGGIHGNEIAGVQALLKFLADLNEEDMHGEFIAITGHKEAIKEKKRYINRDLNRMWSQEQIERVRNMDAKDISCVEECEQKDIIKTLDPILKDTSKNFIFLDLHTTSAEGPPFAFIDNVDEYKTLTSNLYVPYIRGLEKKLSKTFINYMSTLNYMVIAYEAGQHLNKKSKENALAFLWIVSKYLGLLPNVDVAFWQQVLHDDTKDIPQNLTIKYHHKITQSDGFKMKPNYRTFQKIEQGEVLACDVRGDVKAPISGRILFPLYQGQGSDGFFIVQETK